MRKLKMFVLAVALFVPTPMWSVTQATRPSESKPGSPTRDSGKYEKAGPFKVVRHPKQEGLKIEARIREFLWEHWSHKRLGQVVATYYNMEGEPTTCTFFVEPDVDGRWVIREECEYLWLRGARKGEEPPRTKRSRTYSSISRVELLDDNPAQAVPVPDQDDRPPDKYKLLLRDAAVTDRFFL